MKVASNGISLPNLLVMDRPGDFKQVKEWERADASVEAKSKLQACPLATMHFYFDSTKAHRAHHPPIPNIPVVLAKREHPGPQRLRQTTLAVTSIIIGSVENVYGLVRLSGTKRWIGQCGGGNMRCAGVAVEYGAQCPGEAVVPLLVLSAKHTYLASATRPVTLAKKRQAAKKVQFADMMEPASDQEEFRPETVSEAESNELPDGSESEEPVDVVHKQVKDEPHIVLRVPDCTEPEGFIECVKIPASAHFNDVEECVFKAIGCYKNVKKMPQLAYRLKGVRDKHLSKLAKEDDWATLKDDVKSAQVKKKKGDASGVEVEIVLDEDYMASLRHALSGKEGKTVANNGGRGRKKREARIHDLNADSDANSGSDIEERGQLTKREKDYMEALKA
ncbi:hypothetical protein JB92DRAFT_3095475, partial [Gautieria morchelliformis]